jgi:predicted MPP superfamily phosphohydrolase
MSPADLPLALLACFGHVVLWIAVFNWLHSTPLACSLVKRLEKVILLTVAVIFATLATIWVVRGIPPWRPAAAETQNGLLSGPLSWLIAAYMVTCWVAAVWWTVSWMRRRILYRTTDRLLSNDTRAIHVAAELPSRPIDGAVIRLLDRIPGNEILWLNIHHKHLLVPNLPPGLEGSTIAHLSDLHFTGHLQRPYFDYVVDAVNQLEAELVVITGDIVDKTHCLSWIEPTLGRLRAKYGKYFVLGNHDLRVDDVDRLRELLVESGLTDMGGRWCHAPVRDTRLLLAGNERPWFVPLPDVPPVTESPEGAAGPLRVLLAHTPDQFPWARRHQFDLMLAGHTHGGQIRLPIVGPIIAPSRFGVRYASGTFYEAPTLMHVSRGISGLQPIRWNCPPELALLQLTAGPDRQ